MQPVTANKARHPPGFWQLCPHFPQLFLVPSRPPLGHMHWPPWQVEPVWCVTSHFTLTCITPAQTCAVFVWATRSSLTSCKGPGRIAYGQRQGQRLHVYVCFGNQALLHTSPTSKALVTTTAVQHTTSTQAAGRSLHTADGQG
jgi:hypothetical protein